MEISTIHYNIEREVTILLFSIGYNSSILGKTKKCKQTSIGRIFANKVQLQ